MFFVTRARRSVPLSVTELASFLTCPLYFLRNKLQRKRVTPAMKNGLELHRNHYETYASRAVEMTLREAIEASGEGRMVGVEVWVDDGVVGGFIDKLVLEEGRATVLELKSTVRSALWKTSHLQALIYGSLLYPLVEEVVVEVRTFDGGPFFRKRVSERDVELVRYSEKLLLDSIRRGLFPPSPGPHCRLCPFRKDCHVLKEMVPFNWG